MTENEACGTAGCKGTMHGVQFDDRSEFHCNSCGRQETVELPRPAPEPDPPAPRPDFAPE